MKTVIKSIVSILLAFAILLSTTSCAVKEIAGTVAEIAETVSLGSATPTAELCATEKEECVRDSIKESKEDSNWLAIFAGKSAAEVEAEEGCEVKEEEDDAEISDTVISEEVRLQNTFDLAVECVAFDLYSVGYEVFQAIAIVDEVTVSGLGFTKYEPYAEEDGFTVYQTGFIQLVEEGTAEFGITKEDVEKGVTVIPSCEYDLSTGFLLTLGTAIPSYSGIYESNYFRYDQIADYAVSITVKENDRSLWDESIDLYSFDEERFIFKGDLSYGGTSAYGYFSDEAKAYAAAVEAVEKIIEIQNSNAYSVEKQVIIVFSADALEEYLLNSQHGTINGFLIEEINNIQVEENQIVVVTTEGVSVETVVDTEELAKARVTNGIIGFIGGALLVAGSIVITVATCGAGAPLAVTAICIVTGTCATAYGISNMIESGQDIYYGIKGDVYSESFNPVLEGFKKMIPDEETATKVYHAWGLGSSLLQSLVVPATAAIALSRGVGATVWGTTVAVARAVSVAFVKTAVTIAVAGGVSYFTEKTVTQLTNENIGKLVGFGSALVVGALTYKGLNKLDAKFNFSGLNSKEQIPTNKVKDKSISTDNKSDTFLPDEFYSKNAPKQSTPDSSYTHYKYNEFTGEYERSTVYYDSAGRQYMRIDWTNHGRSDHGNPHVHYTTYNSEYRDGLPIRWD